MSIVTERGRLLSVRRVDQGSALTTATATGDQTLFLESVVDFAEEGGQIVLPDGSTIKLYDTIDLVANTIHLTTTVGVVLAVEEPILIYPLSSEYEADVALDDLTGQLIQATVPAYLVPYMPTGIEDPNFGPGVMLEQRDDGDWRVVDLTQSIPLMDLTEFGDPTTFPPPPSDGNPPSTAPVVTAIPGIGIIHLRWDGVINADAILGYRVYMSTTSGFTPGPSNLITDISGTIVTIRADANEAPLVYGTTYYFKVIPYDQDGDGPTSTEVSAAPVQAGIPDLSVGYLQAGGISVSDLLAGTLTAEVLVAALMRTATSGRRVEIDNVGVRLYESDESLLVNLPTDTSDPATFNGDLVVGAQAALTAIGPAELQSIDNVLTKAAILTLLAGQQAPTSSPTLSQNVESYAVDWNTEDYGELWGVWHDGTNLFAFYNDSTAGTHFNTVEKRSSDGTSVLNTVTITAANVADQFVCSMVKANGFWIGLFYRHTTGAWRWEVFAIDGNGLPGTLQSNGVMNESKGNYFRMALSVDGTNVKVCQPNKTVGGGDNKAWLGTYTSSAGGAVPTFSTSVTTTETWNWGGNGPYSLFYGTADFGAARWCFKTGSGQIAVYNTTPTRQTSQEWPTQNANGYLWYDDDVTKFIESNATSDLAYRFENVFWGTTKFWTAFTWYDNNATGGTHETALSPRASITMNNRRRMNVTWPTIPAGGTDDPNSIRLYLKQNASDPGTSFASYFRQGTNFTGTNTTLTSYNTGTAGSQDTAFVGGTGAKLKTASASFELRGDGTLALPKFATASRPATPLEAQFIYDDDGNALWLYNGRMWLPISPYAFDRFAGYMCDFLEQTPPVGTGGASAAPTNSLAQHPGLVAFTATAVNDNSRWFGGAGSARIGDGLLYAGALIRTPANLSDGTNRYKITVGVYDNLDADGSTNGFYLLYQDNIATGTWQARLRASTTLTTDAADDNGGAITVAASTWYLIEFWVNSTGTSIDVRVNGVVKATLTTGLPAAGSTMEPRGGIIKVLGAAARQFEGDMVYMLKEVNAARW